MLNSSRLACSLPSFANGSTMAVTPTLTNRVTSTEKRAADRALSLRNHSRRLGSNAFQLSNPPPLLFPMLVDISGFKSGRGTNSASNTRELVVRTLCVPSREKLLPKGWRYRVGGGRVCEARGKKCWALGLRCVLQSQPVTTRSHVPQRALFVRCGASELVVNSSAKWCRSLQFSSGC